MFPLQLWHLLEQGKQDPCDNCRYILQEVQDVILFARQFEHVLLQPLQLPFATTKPLRQRVHWLFVQFRQFLEQEAQEEPLKYCPGRHFLQLVADPWQVMHEASHGKQLVPAR